jgi:cytoskeletal protein RodZ
LGTTTVSKNKATKRTVTSGRAIGPARAHDDRLRTGPRRSCEGVRIVPAAAAATTLVAGRTPTTPTPKFNENFGSNTWIDPRGRTGRRESLDV